MLSRVDFGSSSSSSSAAGSFSGAGGALARLTADAVAAAQPSIIAIDALGSTQSDQQQALKLALRSKSAFLVNAICTTPTPSVAAACPVARKVHNVRALVSRVTSAELLKNTGLDQSSAFASLARRLPAGKLLGLVSGSGISPQVVLDLFIVFQDVLAPGSNGPPVTLDSLGTDMGFLREFTAFAVAVFASLGMSVVDLESLASKASQLYSTLPSHNKHIVTFVLRQDLRDTFDSFGLSVASWQSTPTLVGLAPLVSSSLHTDAAKARVLHGRIGDLSEFGLPSTGLFGAAVPPASPSSLPLAHSSQHAGAKRKQHPGSSAGSSSSAGGGGAHYGSLWFPITVQQCTVGRVASWGGYFNIDLIETTWSQDFPGAPFDVAYLPCILCDRRAPGEFEARLPENATQLAIQCLGSWWALKKGCQFKISRPADFR